MAVNFDINSPASCQRAYLNYHCYGNSMNITGEQMGQIISRYGDQIPSWQNSAETTDNVDYEFDDSQFEEFVDEGFAEGIEVSGHNGDLSSDIGRTVGDAVFTAGGTTVSILTQTMHNIKGGLFIACAAAFATGLAYMLNKANKEEAEAIDKMKNEMGTAQSNLNAQGAVMADIAENIASLTNEANDANEEAESNINDEKTEYDMYYRVFTTIKNKIETGQPLSESEKTLYKKVVEILNATSVNINNEVETASSTVNDVYEDIEGFEYEYDSVAETIGNVKGFTDFAASIDKTTQNLCYTEMAFQGLNAAMGAEAAFKLGKAALALTGLPWLAAAAWANVALGAAGAVMSGIGVGQQATYAKQIGEEIATRQTTQDLGNTTLEAYHEEVDYFGASLDGISDLSLDVPDNTETPTDAPSIPTTTSQSGNNPFAKPKKE